MPDRHRIPPGSRFSNTDLQKIRQARTLLLEVARGQGCGWCRNHVLDVAAMINSLEHIQSAASSIEQVDPSAAEQMRLMGRRAEELRVLSFAGKIASNKQLLRLFTIPKLFLLLIFIEILGAFMLIYHGLGLDRGGGSVSLLTLGGLGVAWGAVLFTGMRPAWRILMITISIGIIMSVLGLVGGDASTPLPAWSSFWSLTPFIPIHVADFPAFGLAFNVLLLFFVASRRVRYHFHVYRRSRRRRFPQSLRGQRVEAA